MSFLNPTYVLCLSNNDVDISHVTNRFGEHVIEVFRPRLFFERIHKCSLELDVGDRPVDFIDCFPVRYDKGLVGPEPPMSTLMRLSYGQKAPGFALEREYRCAVVLSGGRDGAPQHIDLYLGDITPFARAYSSKPGAL
jgi:hypothetical protein